MLRLTATSSPDHVVYCSSQSLSEDKIDDITKIVKRHAPTGSLTVYGSIQLARLATKFDDIFEKHFHAEVESVKQMLNRQENEEEQKRGLRLALMTAGQPEGERLRREMLKRATLECLSNKEVLSIDEISKRISDDLGLPRHMRVETLQTLFRELERDELVTPDRGRWRLGGAGNVFLETPSTEAADLLMKGRFAVRESIEELIGRELAEDQFQRIWSTLLDFLSGLFYQNGLDIIHAFDTFLSRDESVANGSVLRGMLSDGARRVAAASASFPDDQELIETAILDMLTEREGPAFEWLLNICERFVILCCLGIESSSATEIRRTLTDGGIVPDTDILLTYMCQHAPDHAAVRDLLTRWANLGGKILLAPVVLEEVAYHAWISSADFRETRHLIGKLHGHDILRYVRNAFAREFHSIGAKESHWDMFIGQFRGNSAGDYAKIRDHLSQRLGAGMVSDSFDAQLAERIKKYLVEQTSRDGEFEQEDIDEDTEYKLTRDGRLLASIAAVRKLESSFAESKFVTILSSSFALRRASLRFRSEISGVSQVVFARANFAYLLSMIPEAQLGVDSLRRALFDFGRAGKLRDIDRRALRMIKSAGEHDISWAERSLLSNNLKKSMQDEASRLGVSPEQIKQSIKKGEQPETSARVIVDALAKLSKDPKDAERLKLAERRILELETELQVTKESLRQSRNSPPNSRS